MKQPVNSSPMQHCNNTVGW